MALDQIQVGSRVAVGDAAEVVATVVASMLIVVGAAQSSVILTVDPGPGSFLVEYQVLLVFRPHSVEPC